jgi:hypothetical protein
MGAKKNKEWTRRGYPAKPESKELPTFGGSEVLDVFHGPQIYISMKECEKG